MFKNLKFTKDGVIKLLSLSYYYPLNLAYYFQTAILHYLSKGAAVFSFVYMKQQFFMPVCMVMRAIVNADDLGLYKRLIKGQEDNQFFKT